MDRLFVLAWKLGLGWLVGRRFILLTTTAGKDERRTGLRYAFAGGTFYVALDPEAPWARDLAAKPQALAQAAPGPRAVRARSIEDAGELEAARGILGATGPVLALDGSGDRAPLMTGPDYAWVWPVAAVLWWLMPRRR